eukprot:TRINITY_DN4304_c0_g1_i1.p1 TRINITY_DN4304_c0_g1~~TRINITY_DN4304_c0_g1_i1.p1  ORF type:complete len:270 (+),score=96.62 TRINITY_DN4304_c0_g1_i1:72-812(+)
MASFGRLVIGVCQRTRPAQPRSLVFSTRVLASPQLAVAFAPSASFATSEQLEQKRLRAKEKEEKAKAKAAAQKEKQKALAEKQKAAAERAERAEARRAKAEKPKRALSAYMFFVQARGRTLRTTNPELTMGEVGKMLGQEWRQLSDAHRQVYLQQAEMDKARSVRERASYTANLPPKRPMSSFMLFANDKRADVVRDSPDAGIAEIGKRLGQLWKEADDVVKAEYARKAAEAKAAYEQQMSAFKKE